MICRRQRLRWGNAVVLIPLAFIFIAAAYLSLTTNHYEVATRSEVVPDRNKFTDAVVPDMNKFTDAGVPDMNKFTDVVVIKKQDTERQEEAARRMQLRISHLEKMCHNGTRSQTNGLDFLNNAKVVISPNNGFLHCPVTKAASTFWFRLVHTLNVSGPMKSPYSVPLAPVMSRMAPSLSTLGNARNRMTFLQSAVQSVFVREPYARMFSAYVDKVFAPNPTYWTMWGKRAIKQYRKSPTPQALKCGSDPTFAEVMSLAAVWMKRGDEHFQAAARTCQPCQTNYDVVGKMETFAEDVGVLARHLNLSIAPYLESAQFRYDYVVDAIEDSINSPFSWLPDILPCMSKHELGLRVWRKLQIRGIISRRLAFPYSASSFLAVTSQEFVDAAVAAHVKSTDRAELKRQKRDAFVEAYSSVDAVSLRVMTEAFSQDFLFFSYDPHPEEVFGGKNEERKTSAFDWSQDWLE